MQFLGPYEKGCRDSLASCRNRGSASSSSPIVIQRFRDEVVWSRPVLGAARRRVDQDADRDAPGHKLPVDGAAAGRHDAVVRLRRGRVQAEGLLDARE